MLNGTMVHALWSSRVKIRTVLACINPSLLPNLRLFCANASTFDTTTLGHLLIDVVNKIGQQVLPSSKPFPHELIARIPLDEYRVFAQFRRERFLLPVTLITPTSSSLAQQVDHVFSDLRNHDITTAYYLLSENKSKTVADVVEEAAQGIIIEGTALDKTHEAEWLAQQLRNVKHFGASIDFIEEVYILPDIPSEIRWSTYACIIYSTHDNQFLSLQNLSDVESLDVEQTIRNSYEFAVKLIELLNISKVLKKYNVFKLDELGEFIGHHLRTKSKLADNSKMDNDNSSKIDSEFDLGDDNEDNKDEPSRTKNTRAGC
ncbi:unnamed protein product [Didymodactylos carnosus]|uniref:Uncharacterized protein n=1 Tax=Didymodactylos carnosus TaxID=1234261 RepID=A0A8S2DJ85_9BILA|nr:unnamed protein product [Didymodactylos carnosus]CAF3686288.1 unnamed protein product [Didymodactylos carnosus]